MMIEKGTVMSIAVFIKSGDGRGKGAWVPSYRVHFHQSLGVFGI
jgi:hypothetical protein